MNRKRMLGVLLAGLLALSLLPMSALAVTGADLPQILSENWDTNTLLNYGEDGMPVCYLIPSEFDAEHYRMVSADRGDFSSARMEYDSRGNLTGLTYTYKADDGSVSNYVYTWAYDSQDREIRHTNSTWDYAVETAYDSQGRVETVTYIVGDSSVVERDTYDSQGRLTEKRWENEAAPGVETYSYDGDKLVKVFSVSDGVESETLYTYDEAGHLREKTDARRDPAGDGTMKVTEQMDAYYAYDEAGRMVNLKTDRFNGEGNRDLSEEYQWTYFMDGKLNKQEYVFELPNEDGSGFELHEKNATINYNSAGRVSSVDADGVRFVYSYDEAGNNTGIAVTGDDILGDYTITFTYEPIETQPVTPPASGGFTDVPADAYYADAVAWAVEKGITTGTSATTFSPGATCTRAQVVTFLWRALGEPEAMNGADLFTDVSPDAYYFDAVLWALDNGVTSGTGEGKFSPNEPCTRGQVATFLWRALGKPEVKNQVQSFFDVSPDSYCAQAVQWALDSGVTTGTGDGKFSPNATCTRAQVVTFLYRAMGQAE